MADTGTDSAGLSCLERLKSFCRTPKGFILAAEIVLSLVIIICYAASWFYGYIALATCEMVTVIIFFIVFMMELDKLFSIVNWLGSDLIRAAVGSVLYIITSLICVTRLFSDVAIVAAGVIGFIASILFAYDTYTIFLQIKSSRQHTPAGTGDRV